MKWLRVGKFFAGALWLESYKSMRSMRKCLREACKKRGLQETREVCNNGRGLHKREGLAKTIEDCKNERGSQKRERRSKTIVVGKNERSLQNLGHSVWVSGGKEGFMKMPNQTSSNFKTMINT